MTSDTESIPVWTGFNETGTSSGAIRRCPVKQSITDEKFSVYICPLSQSSSQSVCVAWNSFPGMLWAQEICDVCDVHLHLDQISAKAELSKSHWESPEEQRISLVSLAIVHLALEALIACDYHFLWHFFCHLWEKCRSVVRLSTWRCYLSIFILRNAQRFNETGKGYLKAGSVHCCGCLAVWVLCVQLPQFGYSCCKTPVPDR